MPKGRTFRVAGVDGCRAGWLLAVASVAAGRCRPAARGAYRLERLEVAATFSEVLSSLADCELICVDIPIGLSNGPPRECDIAARKMLGARRSSVFPAPVRAVLGESGYRAAGRLVGLRDGNGRDLAMGLVESWSESGDSAIIRAPKLDVNKVRCIVIGDLVLDLNES